MKATLQKVASDEVDAALVYRTDVIAAEHQVEGIGFPEAQQAINTYPIAALKGSKSPAGQSVCELRSVARRSGGAG